MSVRRDFSVIEGKELEPYPISRTERLVERWAGADDIFRPYFQEVSAAKIG